MSFRKTKSWGPRIKLTEKQETALKTQLNEAGLTCFVDQCWTGSVYVAIGLPEWEKSINGNWYNSLDCGCGDDVAKIRLSGHEEGQRQDSTHCHQGTKSECLTSLKKWVKQIISEHGPQGLAIIAEGPPKEI